MLDDKEGRQYKSEHNIKHWLGATSWFLLPITAGLVSILEKLHRVLYNSQFLQPQIKDENASNLAQAS